MKKTAWLTQVVWLTFLCTLHFIRLVLPVRNNITVLTCACQSSFLQKPGVLRICSCSAYSILISPIVTLHFLIPSSLFEGTAKKYLDASTSYLCIFERFFFGHLYSNGALRLAGRSKLARGTRMSCPLCRPPWPLSAYARSHPVSTPSIVVATVGLCLNIIYMID